MGGEGERRERKRGRHGEVCGIQCGSLQESSSGAVCGEHPQIAIGENHAQAHQRSNAPEDPLFKIQLVDILNKGFRKCALDMVSCVSLDMHIDDGRCYATLDVWL
ncbi:unnamed protein product [Linum tenue]|uniref:Uncharacterized protein n=1 Tax=Linum tenue TaxID=586396 RepID=A0AAV0KP84_9ROSI|nr:unnamed protein product [Linum tenue]